jgi:adenine-specific DNA-methyltransferase
VTSALPTDARPFRLDTLTSQRPGGRYTVTFEGGEYRPEPGYWKPSEDGFSRLINAGRVRLEGRRLAYLRFFDDFRYFRITNVWNDLSGIQSRTDSKIFSVQTPTKVVERCVLLSTDPGDIVLDPTCGSGTAAYVAEQWGRRWITCDTSRVAITLAKQRLMTAEFEYYELAHAEEGVDSGFRYKSVPHVTLKSID